MLYQVRVEWGKKVHPSEVSSVTLLGRQDVGNEMIPIEEPPLAKNGHNGRVGGPIILSLERVWDGDTSDRGGKGTRLCPLGWGSSRRGEGCRLCRVRALGRSLRGLSLRGHGGKKARSWWLILVYNKLEIFPDEGTTNFHWSHGYLFVCLLRGVETLLLCVFSPHLYLLFFAEFNTSQDTWHRHSTSCS
jgi:hypothetical protein